MSRKRVPRYWAGLSPNGLGRTKPNHYWDMLKVAWENRDQLPFAWRILKNGVCDGCALGTTGLKDFTMDGVHLCTVRLNLLRLNTMPALDPAVLEDVALLAEKSSKQLRRLGRLPYPMLRSKGQKGFQQVSWEEAIALAGRRIRQTSPDRLAFYLTSRGITNEVYYMAQKAARYLGTNNVDNSARICHSPSTTGMGETLGVSASTCSYKDWIGSDWVIFIGSDTPNNQPVTTKYLYYAKRKGTRVAVVNPYKEPGLDNYWVPSVTESALFGTKIMDEFFPIHTGGDVAFFNGVLKHLIEDGALDESFVARHTEGFEETKAELERQSWEDLEALSGATRQDMKRLARLLGEARSAVFVWSMGITQHAHGVENVKSIVNLALARGFVGREHCGLMPIRGHSGVQGGAEVGCIPGAFPGGRPVNRETAREMSELWGFEVPSKPGLEAVAQIDACQAGEIDVLYLVGGNFLETLPDPDFVRQALSKPDLRIHQDIVVSSQMLVEPAGDVLLLPAATRYEQPGGGTETSTERYIYYSPEIPGRRIGTARPEWDVILQVAESARPAQCDKIHVEHTQEIREEIARAVPKYAGIEKLSKKGDAVQWGGRLLCRDGDFPRPGGKAAFSPLRPPDSGVPDGKFMLSTRRGRQFNSMVQSKRDPLTGARRQDVLMNPDDMRRLGLKDGAPVLLRSRAGSYRGHAKSAPMRPGNLQVHWPEGNVLIPHGPKAASGVPDYNTLVELEPQT
ncbi:MAG TPA: FdhF/YdeP family oxidoreductase [Acidobacteriota bacterium]|nr:FdhF/YdeP family oxidoreductase [Acidobacteriota bacterium]